MSREPKRMEENVRGSTKMIIYLAVVAIIGIVIISYVLVANIMKGEKEVEIAKEDISKLEEESLTTILTTTEDITNIENTESASSSIGKTVEESNKESEEQTENKEINNENKVDNNNKNVKEENTSEANSTTENNPNSQEVNNKKEEKEISFVMPVEGEIIKGFAKDSLVYSETLQEWVTHQAIDIKAESRDVVKAAANGTVTAIKNDPRYGLTVIIEHDGGFKTVYSNLLTAEFVVEGEDVKQGQTLGTIGNSATFEIADESHLHFEMLKDSVYVDPTIYIK